MLISEIVIHDKFTNWELTQNPKLVKYAYTVYYDILNKSNKFKIPANTIFNEYQITDAMVELDNIYANLKREFSDKSQVVNAIRRVISYIEYNEIG